MAWIVVRVVSEQRRGSRSHWGGMSHCRAREQRSTTRNDLVRSATLIWSRSRVLSHWVNVAELPSCEPRPPREQRACSLSLSISLSVSPLARGTVPLAACAADSLPRRDAFSSRTDCRISSSRVTLVVFGIMDSGSWEVAESANSISQLWRECFLRFSKVWRGGFLRSEFLSQLAWIVWFRR